MEKIITKETEMLERLYKNSKMGSASVAKLIAKTEGKALKNEFTEQLKGYDGFAERAKKLFEESGETPKEENPMTKFWASMGVTMNTLIDSSDSHLAEMAIEGSTMGVTDTIKILKEYESQNISGKAEALAKDIIAFEEKNIETLKSYL